MNKYISIEQGYEPDGQFYLKIHKSKGKLTLEEIYEVARDYDWNYYLLFMDCMHDPDDVQGYGEEPAGHTVKLYRMEDFE